jgi:hypothetical protein
MLRVEEGREYSPWLMIDGARYDQFCRIAFWGDVSRRDLMAVSKREQLADGTGIA